jgi:uncharacterized coiled-coil protein SlyX
METKTIEEKLQAAMVASSGEFCKWIVDAIISNDPTLHNLHPFELGGISIDCEDLGADAMRHIASARAKIIARDVNEAMWRDQTLKAAVALRKSGLFSGVIEAKKVIDAHKHLWEGAEARLAVARGDIRELQRLIVDEKMEKENMKETVRYLSGRLDALMDITGFDGDLDKI